MTAPSRLARTCAAVLALAALAFALPATASAQTVDSNGKPITNDAGTVFQVVAHRGGGGQWPENSLEAYRAAAASGVDGIEADLRWSKDGKPVMMHDPVLPDRCTSAGKWVHQMTLAELSLVRCADLDGNMVVPIPTFEQLAQVLADYPSVKLSLDTKSYPGHSVKGRATYAAWDMALLKKYGLLSRTRIVTYYWGTMLGSIRKASKTIRVIAYDNRPLDLHRVRLAAERGANAYGIRMTDTSAYLARYIKSKGMDLVPYEILGNEQRAFTIAYAGKSYVFLSDHPTSTQNNLVNGKYDLNPVANPVTTTLVAPVIVSTGTYKAGVKHYPLVLGPAVPEVDRTFLDKVTVTVTVTGGKGKGRVYVGPRSGTLETVSAALPKGTKTLTFKVPLGDQGKLRVYTTSTVKLAVAVTAYRNIRFA